MSNMTKTIAILGVVAGLGVAALPLSTYAAPVVWNQTDSDDVSKTNIGVDGGQNYVTTDPTTITLEIQDKLSIESDQATVTLTNTTAGATAGLYTGDNAVNVTVITKNSGGYKLTMVGAGDTTGSKNASSMYNTAGDEIPAGAFTAADGAAVNSSWGYGVAAVDGSPVDSSLTNYQAIPAAAKTIMNRAGATTDAGDKAAVSFGANIISKQAAGTYTGKVTFTATNVAKVTP